MSIAVQVLLSTRVRRPPVYKKSTGTKLSGHIIERLVGTSGPAIIRLIIRRIESSLEGLFGK